MGDRRRYVTTINTAAPGSRETGLGVPLSDIATNTTQNGSNYSKNTALSRIIQGSGPNRGTIATQSSIFTSYNTAFLVDADLGSTAVKNAINDIQVLQDDIGGITTSVENISGAVENMSGVIHNISSIFDEIYDSVKWLSNFNLSQPVIGEIDIDAKLNISGDLNVSGTLNATTLVVSSNVSTYNISVGMLDVTNDINTSYISSNNISTGTINVNSDVTIGGELSIVNINASNISTSNMSVGNIEITNINTNNIVVVNDVVIGGTATVPTLNASNVSTDNISVGMLDVSGDVVISGTATLPTLNASNVSIDNVSARVLDVSGDVVISGTATIPTLNASNVSVDNVSVGVLDVSGDVVISGTATLPTLNVSNITATSIVNTNQITATGSAIFKSTLAVMNPASQTQNFFWAGTAFQLGNLASVDFNIGNDGSNPNKGIIVRGGVNSSVEIPILTADNLSSTLANISTLNVSTINIAAIDVPDINTSQLNASNISVDVNLSVGGTTQTDTLEADTISAGMLDVSGDVVISGTATLPTLNVSNVSVDNISTGTLDVSGDVVIGGTATVPTLNASNVSTDNISVGMLDVSGDVVISGTGTLPTINASNVSADNISVEMLDVSGDVVISGTTTLPTLNASNVSTDNISVGMLDVSGDVVISGTATLPTLNASNVSADNISVNNVSVLGDVTIDGTLVCDLTNNLSAGDGIILTSENGKTTITSTATGYGSGPSLAVDANVSSFILPLILIQGDDNPDSGVIWPVMNLLGQYSNTLATVRKSWNSIPLTASESITLYVGDTVMFNWSASQYSADATYRAIECYLVDDDGDDHLVGELAQRIGGERETFVGAFTYVVDTEFSFYRCRMRGTGNTHPYDTASATCTIYRKTVPISSTSVTANVPVSDFIETLQIVPSGKKAFTNQGINQLSQLITVYDYQDGTEYTETNLFTVYAGDKIHFNWKQSGWVQTAPGHSAYVICYLVKGTNEIPSDEDRIEVGRIYQYVWSQGDHEEITGSFVYNVTSEFSFYRSQMKGADNLVTQGNDYGAATATVYRSNVPNSVLIPQLLDATNISCDNISVTTLDCGNVSCDNISVNDLSVDSGITTSTIAASGNILTEDSFTLRTDAFTALTITNNTNEYRLSTTSSNQDIRICNATGAGGLLFDAGNNDINISQLNATNILVDNDLTVANNADIDGYLSYKPRFIAIYRSGNLGLTGIRQGAVFDQTQNNNNGGEFGTANGSDIQVATGGWYRVSWGLGFQKTSNPNGERTGIRVYTRTRTNTGSFGYNSAKGVIGGSVFLRSSSNVRQQYTGGMGLIYIPASGWVQLTIDCMIEGNTSWTSSFNGTGILGSSRFCVEYVSNSPET